MKEEHKISYEEDYEKYYFEYKGKYTSDINIVNSIRKLEYERAVMIEIKDKYKMKICDPSELIGMVAILIAILSLAEQIESSDNVQGGIVLFIIFYIAGGLLYRNFTNKKYNDIIEDIETKINSKELCIIALKNLLYEKYKRTV